MGFSITWCAVREHDAHRLLKQLGLSPTGESEDSPDSLISMVVLDSGWRIVWYNHYVCPFLSSSDLELVSKLQEVLVCRVEEHVMASSAELWSAGKRKWWISHEGERGPKGLSVDGDLPDCFAATRDQMEAAQLAEGGEYADVDFIFEIPLKVAQSLVGFKHDEDCPHVTKEQFIVLTRAAPKRGLLARLLGVLR